MPRVAVLKYPGTNCEEETRLALEIHGKVEAKVVWHTELDPSRWDAVVIPGGFSYGDHGRAGLVASHSPATGRLRDAAENGVPVLGICNGFQILVEAGLLPGALLPNAGGRFLAKWVKLRVHRPRGPWLQGFREDRVYTMPVAHAEGRFYHPRVAELLRDRPWLQYTEDVNGSVERVAGIGSRDGTVLGMMPHPERAAWPWQPPPMMKPDGVLVFTSIGAALRRGW